MKEIHVECFTETGVDKGLIEKIKKSEYTGDGSDLNCFTKCFFLKAGFLNDKGEFLVEDMKEMLKPEEEHEKLFKLVDDCNAKPKDKDLCKSTFTFYKCWWDTIKAEHLLKKMHE